MFPCVPGFEGSGTVVAYGGNLISGFMGWRLMGQRVAFAPSDARPECGSWCQYTIADAIASVALPDEVSFEQGALALVNPLTAVAMLELAAHGRHAAMVSTAAASTLGQMMVKIAPSKGLTLINVVRREAQVKLLKGTRYKPFFDVPLRSPSANLSTPRPSLSHGPQWWYLSRPSLSVQLNTTVVGVRIF